MTPCRFVGRPGGGKRPSSPSLFGEAAQQGWIVKGPFINVYQTGNMIDPFQPISPFKERVARKPPSWLVFSWLALGICHAFIVWSARIVSPIPLWTLIGAAVFIGTAGPYLLDRLDNEADDLFASLPPLSATEKDRLIHLMSSFVVAILLFTSLVIYMVFV